MRSVFKAFAGLMMFAVAGQAFADLAATHIIRNEVLVDYNDAAATPQTQVSATVDITVNLVEVAPSVTFDGTASDPLDPVGVGEQISLVYTVYSQANGLDTYTLVATDPGTPGDVSIDSYLPTSPLSLAATTVTTQFSSDTSGGPIVITVPADGTANTDVNGFTVTGSGQKVFFDVGAGVTCDVDSTDDTNGGVFNATSTITVSGCDNVETIPVGTVIGELVTVTVAITGVSVGAADVTFTVTSQSDGAATATGGTQSVVVAAPDIQVFKFVRNVTNGGSGAPYDGTCSGSSGLASTNSCVVLGSNTYYRAGVTTDPGDTLEYAIVVLNGGAQAQAIQVTDTIVAFTSFLGLTINVVPLATSATPDSGSDCATDGNTCTIVGTPEAATASTTGDDSAAFIDPDVEASAGHDGAGGSPATEVVGGLLESGEYSVITFNVQVDG